MTTTTTTDPGPTSLLRLLTWLSPAFPVGGFAYSGGLEAAVREGHVANAEELREWLDSTLRHGSMWNDAVLLVEAWNASGDPRRLRNVADTARALAGSAERYLEITAQGDAFLEAASSWATMSQEGEQKYIPYSVAVGGVAFAGGVPLEDALVAWLHALVSQSVSAAIRLSVLGQRDAMALMAVIEETILDVARRVRFSTLDELGGASILADILSARHETLGSRLFRS